MIPGAFSSIPITTGAPHRCVTPSESSSPRIAAASTRRRQTCVPASAVTVQGKHQPLQWNIGSVHRYTGCRAMPQVTTLPSAFRYAPRWWYTTPFGRPVVPEV